MDHHFETDTDYGDPEGDTHDSWSRECERRARARRQRYLHAKATRPPCEVEGCEHPAYYDCEWFPNYADFQLCRKHTIARIMK